MSTVFPIGGLLSGFIFAPLYRKLFAAFIAGLSFGWAMPACISIMSSSITTSQQFQASALFLTATNLAQFINPSLLSLVRLIPNCDTVNAMFAAAAIGLGICSVFAMAYFRRIKTTEA